MGFLKMFLKLRLLLFIWPLWLASARAEQSLSIDIGGGYAANLYADSFDIGNSYLVNALSFSSAHFDPARLKLYYSLSYLEHNTNDIVNNFFQVLGANLYRRERSGRFKWGIDLFGAAKNYVDGNSDFDNYRIFLVADAAYYISPGLQIKGIYRDTRSIYAHFSSLDNFEHRIDLETALTLPSHSTLRGTARYATRMFDEDSRRFEWIDIELGASQSLGIATGIGVKFMRRWSGDGSRPLSTYFILSGITPYWDPWEGNQAEFSAKRILPFAVVSDIDVSYWRRQFSYDDLIRERLPWLRQRADRTDEGFLVKLGIRRQFNIDYRIGRAVAISTGGGYLSNDSNDPFYEYDNYFINADLEFRIL
jgi:hypothetical protein